MPGPGGLLLQASADILIPPCHHLADKVCSLKISQAPGVTNGILNLDEVELYDTTGAHMPQSTLGAVLSTTFDGGGISPWKADHAIDGSNTSTVHTMPGDPNPTLTIFYPCPFLHSSVSRVVVVNRHGSTELKDRINGFRLEYFNALGIRDRVPFGFSGGQDVYIIEQWAGGC
jgi:hypothetical protein